MTQPLRNLPKGLCTRESLPPCHPPMLLIFLCALGISFSFMATRKRCSGFPTHPVPVGSRSPSRLIHAEWRGGFASRFIRRCVDTQREGGGIYLRFSSYFLLPILQMSVEGSQEASILTHLLPFRSETVSFTLVLFSRSFTSLSISFKVSPERPSGQRPLLWVYRRRSGL